MYAFAADFFVDDVESAIVVLYYMNVELLCWSHFVLMKFDNNNKINERDELKAQPTWCFCFLLFDSM